MLDLKDMTFIIPVRIENQHRARNVKLVLDNLLHRYDTTIKVIESGPEKLLDKLVDVTHPNLDYKFELNDEPTIHRTRLINEMLYTVETPIVVNYDADILVEDEAFIHSRYLLTSAGNDVVYPYGYAGVNDEDNYRQIRIWDEEDFYHLFDGAIFDTFKSWTNNYQEQGIIKCDAYMAQYGHIQILKTAVYRNAYMENENYRHLCPEDWERHDRFKKLGYRVVRVNQERVYHFEHPKGNNLPDLGIPMQETINELDCMNLLHEAGIPVEEIHNTCWEDVESKIKDDKYIELKKAIFIKAKAMLELVPTLFEVYEIHYKLIGYTGEQLVEYYENESYWKKYERKKEEVSS